MRINELARELEVKAKTILDFLSTIGVVDERSHSSSISGEIEEKVRQHFAAGTAAAKEEEAVGAAVSDKETAPSEALASGPEPSAAFPSEPPAPAAVQERPESPVSSPASEPRPVVPAAGRTVGPLDRGEHRPPPVTRQLPGPGGSTVLRPPIRHSTLLSPPLSPRPAAASPAPPAPPGAAPAGVEEKPAASGPAPAAPVKPGPAIQPVVPPAPQLGVQGPMGAPRPGVPGPVRRSGGLPPPPVVSPPVRPVPPRGLAPGQPIYQPPPGVRRRPGQPREGAGAPGGGVAGRPGGLPRSLPGAPVAPGRYERRPMHPTRLRPAAGAGATPAVGERARPSRPSIPQREREGPLRGGPPRTATPVFTPLPLTREMTVMEGITVKDLAEKLEIKAKDLMQRLISRGIFATINQALEAQVATEVARDFGAEARVISLEQEALEVVKTEREQEAGELLPRPPVVTIMGHVDHGKTSLLDVIRQTRVTEQEAGGITQHIGAYQVEINSRKITFIDTPGHEAFTRMRARGSKVTDIVVLVVAADDGVMPQTLEAMNHARAANVPIVVAINKVDKPEANPERVKRQLSERDLMPEEWGGHTVTVEVSAKNNKNLDLLLEMILLVADLRELKANPSRPGMGTVLEAKLDRGRGPVATVLVQNGTLRGTDPFIVGAVFGKVRALLDDRSRALQEAPPATPVEVLGLNSLPQVGDQLQVVPDLLKAKQTALYREQKMRAAVLARSARLTLNQLHEQMKAGVVKDLNLILKADVQGSAEVLTETLTKLATEKVKVKIIHAGVGAITESDVLLGSASNAVIIGFNVRPERKAQETAEQEKVDIRLYTVIYNVVEEIKKAMIGLLEPTWREVLLGRAEVRELFHISRVGTIAGCYVQDGRLTRDAEVRLLRDNVVVYTGRIASLRRFKDDISEVKSGFECGVVLENFPDVKQGDVLEAFATEKIAAEVLA